MRCTCAVCDISFASIKDYQKHICENEWKNANKDAAGYQHYKEEKKMTREEAIKVTESVMKYRDGNWTAKKCIECFEALGLLKFDEPKKEVIRLCSYEDNDLGMVKVEQWPEGLVLWVGGVIVWKSWVNPVPDLVVIEARKYVDDCRVKPYSKEEAFTIIGDHFKMLEKLLEYVEKKKGA